MTAEEALRTIRDDLRQALEDRDAEDDPVRIEAVFVRIMIKLAEGALDAS